MNVAMPWLEIRRAGSTGGMITGPAAEKAAHSVATVIASGRDKTVSASSPRARRWALSFYPKKFLRALRGENIGSPTL